MIRWIQDMSSSSLVFRLGWTGVALVLLTAAALMCSVEDGGFGWWMVPWTFLGVWMVFTYLSIARRYK